MADFPKDGPPIEAGEYNELPLLEEANKVLQSTPPGPEALFRLVAPQFIAKDPKGYYTFFLVHRHYKLNAGERMVSNGRLTDPQVGTAGDPRVIASSWTLEGRPYEWTRLTSEEVHVNDLGYRQELLDAINSVIPPSVEGDNLRRVLGVSLAQSEVLPPDDVWWENLNDEKRQHILTTRRRQDVPPSAIRTSWIPKQVPAGGMEYTLACCGVCHHSRESGIASIN